MDASTEKMITTFGASIVRKLLLGAGASLATHGVIASNEAETFVSVGMFAAGVTWSFWNDYGRAIVLSKLDVWKATAQAQSEALRAAKVTAPTASQIAAKIPDPSVTAVDVAKVVARG